MGWSYRKSINAGPFRINLSKSGIGYSVGGAGFRRGVRANGRRYSSFNIPGTGITYRPSGRQASQAGCAILVAAVALSGTALWFLA